MASSITLASEMQPKEVLSADSQWPEAKGGTPSPLKGHLARLGAESLGKTKTLHSRPVWTWSSMPSKSNQLPTAGPDVCSVCSYALSPQATHNS